MKLEDIAKIAGVSKSAVSLAFNDKPGISSETRERILKIAKDYGYTPKPRASSDSSPSKALTFLVITNSGIVLEEYYQQPFFRELIQYIEERCRAKGYSMMFSSLDMGAFERDVRLIADDPRSDGLILLGTNLSPEHISYIASHQRNLVVLDTSFDTLPVHFVEINNFMGAYQAGKHLYEIGHRQIGYISSNVRIHNFDERRRGFSAALEERGIQVTEPHLLSVAPTILSSQESLRKQLEQFLAKGGSLPTALFCECDYIAISAMKTLAELGFSIPGDISVVGFDNITESVIVSPELTTIHVEKERMAHLAVDLLIGSIHDAKEVRTKIKVDTRIVLRHSSAAPQAESLRANSTV
ncbi:LacI family DNA-binding transcriptional regulator [Paenibacillus sp. PL2-23]|uniref:LacI family DNA-binding transcriptional regulator n=1 Tax=Paenibacillus sp. PL2-23 TaxID=2100729 RepID=UPI0030FB2862